MKEFSDDDIPVMHVFDLTDQFEKMYAEASERKIQNQVFLYNHAIDCRMADLGKQLERIKSFEHNFKFIVNDGDE
jgi:hypothetical protein